MIPHARCHLSRITRPHQRARLSQTVSESKRGRNISPPEGGYCIWGSRVWVKWNRAIISSSTSRCIKNKISGLWCDCGYRENFINAPTIDISSIDDLFTISVALWQSIHPKCDRAGVPYLHHTKGKNQNNIVLVASSCGIQHYGNRTMDLLYVNFFNFFL